MATTDRGPDLDLSWAGSLSVLEVLAISPYRFNAFQTVRLLERLLPDRDPVGRDSPPDREIVRFRAHISLDFPASQIQDLSGCDSLLPQPRELYSPKTDFSDRRTPEPGASQHNELEHPPVLWTNFFGLYGTLGAMPRCYTEAVLEWKKRQKDQHTPAFMDMFHHRLVSLLYRAWEKYQFVRIYECDRLRIPPKPTPTVPPSVKTTFGPPFTKPAGVSDPPRTDRFSRMLLALTGLGIPSLQNRMDEVSDDVMLFFSGFFAQQRRSAVNLQRILQDFFGFPVNILSFQGRWLQLPAEEYSRLGSGTDAQHNALGKDLTVGTRVWDAQGKFRICAGPMGMSSARAFFPEAAAFVAMIKLVRQFAGMEWDFDLQLIIRAPEVPFCQLDRQAGAWGPQLGRSAWMMNNPQIFDNHDVVFPADAYRPARKSQPASSDIRRKAQ